MKRFSNWRCRILPREMPCWRPKAAMLLRRCQHYTQIFWNTFIYRGSCFSTLPPTLHQPLHQPLPPTLPLFPPFSRTSPFVKAAKLRRMASSWRVGVGGSVRGRVGVVLNNTTPFFSPVFKGLSETLGVVLAICRLTPLYVIRLLVSWHETVLTE